MRTYLQEGLGWLKGYPVQAARAQQQAGLSAAGGALAWRAPATGGSWRSLLVDRECLRRSFFALRGAQRKFPNSLEGVVGDIESWKSRTELRLRQVQSVVHGRQSLETGLGLHPGPAELLSVLEWLAWCDRTELLRMRLAVEHWGSALLEIASTLGESTARRMALEVFTRPGAASHLGCAHPWLSAATAYRLTSEACEATRDLPATPPSEAPPIGAQAVQFLLEEAEPLAIELTLRCVQPGTRSLVEIHEMVQAGLKRLPKSSVKEVLRCLVQLEDVVPAEGATTEAFLKSAMGTLYDLSERRRAELLTGLADRLESGAGQALSPNQRFNFARLVTQDLIEFSWGAHDIPWERRHTVLDAALQICAAPMPAKWIKKLLKSWQIGAAFEGYAVEVQDPARLAALTLQRAEDLPWEAATLVARFAVERDPTTPGTVAVLPFVEVKEALSRPAAFEGWSSVAAKDSTGARQLVKLSRSGVLRMELRQAAAAEIQPHELARFAALHARAKCAPSEALASPPGPLTLTDEAWSQLDAWIPNELADAVRCFLAHAQLGALAKALGPRVKDPRAHRVERDAIAAKLQAGSAHELTEAKRSALEIRLRRLTDQRGPMSPQDMEHVRERLHAHAVRARFRRWLARLQKAALGELPERARGAIDLEVDRQAEAVIAGLRALNPPTRRLAHRLLTARAGPRPWDLRRDPANVAWAGRAAAHGLDLSRWFSDEAFIVPTPEEHAVLRFALEPDPLEVMKMGLWFDTCLAPEDTNFFSTIANAADANKRVLVARDGNGTVQARCLLAITEEWHLLAFHVYAHEGHDWINGAVKAVLQSLCEALGTGPAPRGKVPTLVASRWYDDGPVDLAEQMATLQPGGELAARLVNAPPSSAYEMVNQVLGTSVVEVALELVLSAPVFFDSPARTASFAPLLTTRRLPRHFALSLIARLAGSESEIAQGMITKLCRGKNPLRLNLAGYEALTLASAFRQLKQPGKALQVLRGRDDGYDAAEVQRETARALEEMGRMDAARRIWESLALNS